MATLEERLNTLTQQVERSRKIAEQRRIVHNAQKEMKRLVATYKSAKSKK